jgi:hypothetical protein
MGVEYMQDNPLGFLVSDPEHFLITKRALNK